VLFAPLAVNDGVFFFAFIEIQVLLALPVFVAGKSGNVTPASKKKREARGINNLKAASSHFQG
jgi:hypothetical protein